jgi:ATP-dependent RNA helicase RhlE
MEMTMKDLNLIPALAEAVEHMGFNKPTPIQQRAIPIALEGRDLIGCASTGTGKTAAFLLPLLQRLRSGKTGGCRALILSPTRELALQTDEQALALGYYLGLSAVCVVGGVKMEPQERALKAGSDIIVATPGRLLDHMRFQSVDLSQIEVLVLDEADRMLDMGFLPDITRILAALPAQRQTLLFSATMSPKIRALAGDILRDPEMVTVDRQKPADGIEQSVFLVAQERKAALLSRLLRREGMQSVLVFVRRKSDADRLARSVQRGGIDATSIHADRTQEQRIEALEDFRKGRRPVLVATDVAARGLDVDGISHVINFDVPHSPDDYIHRGGRTARAGAVGDVITFVSPEERRALAEIERVLGSEIPRRNEPGFDEDRATRNAPYRQAAEQRDVRNRGRETARQRSRPRNESGAVPASSRDLGEKGRGSRRRDRRRSRPAVVSAP